MNYKGAAHINCLRFTLLQCINTEWPDCVVLNCHPFQKWHHFLWDTSLLCVQVSLAPAHSCYWQVLLKSRCSSQYRHFAWYGCLHFFYCQCWGLCYLLTFFSVALDSELCFKRSVIGALNDKKYKGLILRRDFRHCECLQWFVVCIFFLLARFLFISCYDIILLSHLMSEST